MKILTNADWNCLNKFLKGIYAPCNLDAFPVQLITALLAIFGSDSSGAISFNIKDITFPALIAFPDFSAGVVATSFAPQPQHFFS